MNDRVKDLLYRSYDAELSASEREELERALSDSAELRVEMQQLDMMRASVARAAAESFELGFAERVSRRLENESGSAADALYGSIRQMFRYVAAAAVPVCIVLVIWNFQIDGTSSEAQAETVWETPVQTLLSNGP